MLPAYQKMKIKADFDFPLFSPYNECQRFFKICESCTGLKELFLVDLTLFSYSDNYMQKQDFYA